MKTIENKLPLSDEARLHRDRARIGAAEGFTFMLASIYYHPAIFGMIVTMLASVDEYGKYFELRGQQRNRTTAIK